MLKKLNNLKIRDRLVKSFIIIACILSAVSVGILIAMFVMSQLYSSTLIDYGFAQGDIGRTMAQFADSRSAMRGIIGYDDQAAIDTLLENHETYKSQYFSLVSHRYSGSNHKSPHVPVSFPEKTSKALLH